MLQRARETVAGPPDEHGAHTDLPGALDVGPDAVAHHDGCVGRLADGGQSRLEDRGVWLQVPEFGRRNRGREDVVEREVRREFVQGPLRVRDQADLQPRLRQRPQRRLHVVIEEEVVAGGPLVVDVPGREVRAGPSTAHVLDDRPRVVDEELRIVVVRLDLVEYRGRLSDGRPKQRRVDRDTVAGTEVPVALALEGRAGVDQREIDVEEDGARHRVIRRARDRGGDHYTGPAARTGRRIMVESCS